MPRHLCKFKASTQFPQLVVGTRVASSRSACCQPFSLLATAATAKAPAQSKTRRSRLHRPRRHPRPPDSRRRAAGRTRRPSDLPQSFRQSRAGATPRAHDRRHYFRPRIAHQSVATTTAVMQLVQKGEVRLNDPVAKYIPEFAQNGKEDITVRNLLTHLLRPARRLRSRSTLERPGSRSAPGLCRNAGLPARLAFHLQRHQFHHAGRAGRTRDRNHAG